MINKLYAVDDLAAGEQKQFFNQLILQDQDTSNSTV